MARQRFGSRIAGFASLVVWAASGCHHTHDLLDPCDSCRPPAFNRCAIPDVPVPKELNKISMTDYVVETPDVLQIDVVRVVPRPPYPLEPFDVLTLSARNVFDQFPINGTYPIDADGAIDLGSRYGGTVPVAGLTTEEAQRAIQARVRDRAKAAEVTVLLARTHRAQQIAGQRTVRPDGTVNLGTYGSVYVAGLTLTQVKEAIETHLSQHLYRPEVTVDVCASNSKFYYVIADLPSSGERVVRLPHTGNETVLDAVSLVGGSAGAAGKRVWVARPGPAGCDADQILPVDWCGIARRGQVKTNYQIMPNDRVYVLATPPPEGNAARAIAPGQRLRGVTLLGPHPRSTLHSSGDCGEVVFPVDAVDR